MANQVTRYQGLNSALSLRDAMDRLFEDSFVWPRWFLTSQDSTNGMAVMPLDMFETADEIVVTTALPGVRPNDLNVQFQDGRLIIDAATIAPKLENVVFHYRELGYGQYHREITLPAAIDTNKVDATFENGILTLHLPKAEEVKPKKIQVKTTVK